MLLTARDWLVFGYGANYGNREHGRNKSTDKQQHLAQEHFFTSNDLLKIVRSSPQVAGQTLADPNSTAESVLNAVIIPLAAVVITCAVVIKTIFHCRSQPRLPRRTGCIIDATVRL